MEMYEFLIGENSADTEARLARIKTGLKQSMGRLGILENGDK